MDIGDNKFLSTPSARRATFQAGLFAAHHDISIHALREEGDPNLQHLSISFFEFLSTPSARRATHLFADGAQEGVISIHALREEGDARKARKERECKISIHALREEGDGGPDGRP